ncbi:SPla/RYanodine receptor (SPRY) domain-containing protein, partial [Striga asiatica]
MASDFVSWKVFFLSTLFHAAPWQLYTPTTPVCLFIFHIFKRLGYKKQWGDREGGPGEWSHLAGQAFSIDRILPDIDRPTTDSSGRAVVLGRRMERMEHVPIRQHYFSKEDAVIGNRSYVDSIVAHTRNAAIISKVPGNRCIKRLMILPGELDPSPKPCPKRLQYTLHVHLHPIHPSQRQVAMQLIVKPVHVLGIHQTQTLNSYSIRLPSRLVFHNPFRQFR